MEKTVIFLDIDGVLNTCNSSNSNYQVNKSSVEVLSKLVKEIGTDIVLTTSWRAMFSENGQPLEAPAKNLVDILARYGLSIKGKVPDVSKSRDELINYYLRRHMEYTNYVSLDDDPSEYVHELKNVYFTDYKKGLVDTDIKKIIKVLRR